MGDMDLPPEQIQGYLYAVMHTIAADKIPAPHERALFTTLAIAAASGAAWAVGNNVVNEVFNWFG